jgi:Lactoylglutathione lyase and related lyases
MAKTNLQARSLIPSITVNDLERSRKFYVEGLGFTLKDEWKDDKGVVNGLMLSAGSDANGLGVAQDDFKKGRDRAKGIGTRLWIETDQDIEAIAKNLKAAGFPLESEAGKLPWGPMGFMVSDPDGYKLTITQPS